MTTEQLKDKLANARPLHLLFQLPRSPFELPKDDSEASSLSPPPANLSYSVPKSLSN